MCACNFPLRKPSNFCSNSSILLLVISSNFNTFYHEGSISETKTSGKISLVPLELVCPLAKISCWFHPLTLTFNFNLTPAFPGLQNANQIIKYLIKLSYSTCIKTDCFGQVSVRIIFRPETLHVLMGGYFQ